MVLQQWAVPEEPSGKNITMKNEPPKPWEIRELVEASDTKAMTINREYQRGAVWKRPQQKH